jgi:hypothetical protein
MKRRHWMVIGSVVLAAAVLGTCGVSCVLSKGPTPRQVERQIRADLPPGTPRAAVEDYLRVRGIQFAAKESQPLATVVAEAGLGDQEVNVFIQAIVEPAFVDPLLPGEVVVYFLFDREGRLLGYAFHPFAHAL